MKDAYIVPQEKPMYYNTATDSNLETYFDEMRGSRMLDRNQEVSLSKRIRKGDSMARQELVESNLRLVVKIARTYRTSRASLSEIIQEGNVGLVQAASRYDYRKNAKFSTYAAPWIKQSINRFLNDKTRAISIPHRKEEKLKRIRLARELLQHELGKEPSNQEIAEYLGIELSDLEKHLAYELETCPLETEDSVTSVIRFWEDSSFSPERDLLHTCLREDTAQFIGKLRENEQTVIRHRFEINGAKRMTLRELGNYLGISAESVRLLEKKAIGKLRVTAKPLVEYLYEPAR